MATVKQTSGGLPGQTLLIEEGSFLEAASAGRVAAVPFGAERSRVLVSGGSQGGWSA
jgi:hypothetical protein